MANYSLQSDRSDRSDPELELDNLFSRTAKLFSDDEISLSRSSGSFLASSDPLTSTTRNSREFTFPFPNASTSGSPFPANPLPTPLSTRFSIRRKPIPSPASSTTSSSSFASPGFSSHCIACAAGAGSATPLRPKSSKWSKFNPARKFRSRSAKDPSEPIHSIHCPQNSRGDISDRLLFCPSPSPAADQDLVELLNRLESRRDDWAGNESDGVHVIDLSRERSQTGNGRTEAFVSDEWAARRLKLEEEAREFYDTVSRDDGRWAHNDYMVALQLQADMAEQETVPASRECTVCGDDFPIPQLPALMNCIHEPKVCAGCFASWIASALDSKGWRHIGCPESNCRTMLDHVEVQLYAAPEVFQKFDALSMRDALNDDPDFRWCLRPGCNSGQIHDGAVDDPRSVCNDCGFAVCIKHERAWHEGETCEEYDYRISGRQQQDQAAEEAASKAEINRSSKKCPGRNCAYNIQKNEGCDHMTCSKCKYEFCWECLADYNTIRRRGNAYHNSDCKYLA